MQDQRTNGRTGTLVAVVVAAACMRSAITAVGPLLHLIHRDTGLNDTQLGLLSALPLLGFAAVSPLLHGPTRRLGAQRMVAISLAVLAAATAVRSLPALAPLWIGTALLGGAIAVCNVLLPAIVKRDFADRVTLMTGCYTAVMGAMAALASGVALPLADAIGDGWRWSLGIWAVPAALGSLLWWTRRPTTPDHADDDEPHVATTPDQSVWRDPHAWAITAYMGLQSTCFYVLIAWLPSIMTSHGFSSSAAGWYLFAFQVVGLLSGLAMPLFTRHLAPGPMACVAAIPLVLAVVGIVLAPSLLPLWVAVAGVASGASLVSALSLISFSATDTAHAVRLSGMAQSVGYLVAAGGPVAAGWLHDTSGSWTLALVLLGVVGALQVGAALGTGHRAVPA